jgi:hypothetical protein
MSTQSDIETIIMLMLKNTLEFNASVVALSTLYVGNMDKSKNQEKFLREYKKLTDNYSQLQDSLTNDIKKIIFIDEQTTEPSR